MFLGDPLEKQSRKSLMREREREREEERERNRGKSRMNSSIVLSKLEDRGAWDSALGYSGRVFKLVWACVCVKGREAFFQFSPRPYRA